MLFPRTECNTSSIFCLTNSSTITAVGYELPFFLYLWNNLKMPVRAAFLCVWHFTCFHFVRQPHPLSYKKNAETIFSHLKFRIFYFAFFRKWKFQSKRDDILFVYNSAVFPHFPLPMKSTGTCDFDEKEERKNTPISASVKFDYRNLQESADLKLLLLHGCAVRRYCISFGFRTKFAEICFNGKYVWPIFVEKKKMCGNRSTQYTYGA